MSIGVVRSKMASWTIILLVLIPLLGWMAYLPLPIRFISIKATLLSFSQIAALEGTTLFAISLCLSGRFAFLEDYFNGISNQYRAHYITGGIAFILLISHFILLLGSYAFDSFAIMLSLFLPQTIARLFALSSFFILIVMMIFTYWFKLPYEVWKLSHKFLGIAFVFGVMHYLLVPSDVTSYLPLEIYIFTISGAGIFIYLYYTILGFKLIHKYQYTIEKIKQLNNNTWEIDMEPKDHKISFIPGQFVFVSFYTPGFSTESHPFSIASMPTENGLKLTIKSLGDYTRQLKRLVPGSLAFIEGPFGRFLEQERENQIWIAGGIGITAFLSKIEMLDHTDINIDLYYVVHNSTEAVYLDEILKIASRFKNFRVCLYDTGKEGHITASAINKISEGLDGKDIYVCGPQQMMNMIRNQFIALKVPKNKIHIENFAMR